GEAGRAGGAADAPAAVLGDRGDCARGRAAAPTRRELPSGAPRRAFRLLAGGSGLLRPRALRRSVEKGEHSLHAGRPGNLVVPPAFLLEILEVRARFPALLNQGVAQPAGAGNGVVSLKGADVHPESHRSFPPQGRDLL